MWRLIALVIVILIVIIAAAFVPSNPAAAPVSKPSRHIRWDPTTYADDGSTGVLKDGI